MSSRNPPAVLGENTIPFPIIPLAPGSTAQVPLLPGPITLADEHIASVHILVHNQSDMHVVQARGELVEADDHFLDSQPALSSPVCV